MGLKEFFQNTKRIFIVSKKSTSEEYWNLVKITGLGILVIGLIGFIVMLILRVFYSPM